MAVTHARTHGYAPRSYRKLWGLDHRVESLSSHPSGWQRLPDRSFRSTINKLHPRTDEKRHFLSEISFRPVFVTGSEKQKPRLLFVNEKFRFFFFFEEKRDYDTFKVLRYWRKTENREHIIFENGVNYIIFMQWHKIYIYISIHCRWK